MAKRATNSRLADKAREELRRLRGPKTHRWNRMTSAERRRLLGKYFSKELVDRWAPVSRWEELADNDRQAIAGSMYAWSGHQETMNPRNKKNGSRKARRTLKPRKLQTSAGKRSKNGLGSWVRRTLGMKPRQISQAKKRMPAKALKPATKWGPDGNSLKPVPTGGHLARKRAQEKVAKAATSGVIADVIAALRNQGYEAAAARKMAQAGASRAGSGAFDDIFRAALAKANPKRKAPKPRKPATKGKRNPGQGQLAEAQRMYETFHGRQSKEVIEVLRAEGVRPEVAAKIAGMIPPEDYTGMGALVQLDVAPIGSDARKVKYDQQGKLKGGEVESIKFGERERPRVCCDPAGEQIYFVGGNQDVSALLKQAQPLGFALADLGEVTKIEYLTRKAFDSFELVIYFHQFGEETGERPHLFFSPAHRLLYLVGGAYDIKAEGIVN